MKKTLLVALTVGFGLSAFAQTGKHVSKAPKKTVVDQDVVLDIPAPIHSAVLTKNSASTQGAISVVLLGTSANLFTTAFGSRTALDFNPSLDLVTFVHRSNPAADGDGSSGWLRYDYSKDGGATWMSQKGPIFTADNTVRHNARYPQAVIIKNGSQPADSAYLAFFAPTLSAANGAWGGVGYGSMPVGRASGPGAQNQDSRMGNYISSAGHISGSNAVFVDLVYDLANGVYLDSVSVWKVTGAGAITRSTFPFVCTPGTEPTDFKVAFAPNGQTGFICFLGNINSNVTGADTAIQPILVKTTDGGATWGTPYQIDVNASAFASIKTDLGLSGNATCGFEVDLVVDKNGKAHVVCAVGGAQGYGTILNAAGAWGIYHFISDGSSASARLLRKPMTFRGTFGAGTANELNEDSRPQASMNETGDMVYFVHFDTDTNTFGGAGNTYPDAYVDFYNVNSSSGSSNGQSANITVGTAGDGALLFANVAPWVKNCSGGGVNIPISFTSHTVTNDNAQPGQHKFLAGVCFVGIKEVKNNDVFTVSQNMPNPFSGVTMIEVNMLKSSQVTVDVYDMLGAKVMSTINENLASGTHTMYIDGSKLNSGVYFYTVNAGGFTVTKKMIVE